MGETWAQLLTDPNSPYLRTLSAAGVLESRKGEKIEKTRERVAERLQEAPPEERKKISLEYAEKLASRFGGILQAKKPGEAIQEIAKILEPLGISEEILAREIQKRQGQFGAPVIGRQIAAMLPVLQQESFARQFMLSHPEVALADASTNLNQAAQALLKAANKLAGSSGGSTVTESSAVPVTPSMYSQYSQYPMSIGKPALPPGGSQSLPQ
jgi:hypothetical protein